MGVGAKPLPLVLIGAGGHAKVLLSMARGLGRDVIGICDPELANQRVADWRGINVLGDDSALDCVDPTSVELINGIGQLVGKNHRQVLHDDMKRKGFCFVSLVHPMAWVDTSVRLGEGVQIMAGVVIQADSVIGDSSIVNTQASIDHDCNIARHVHVAPGATICGGVVIEEGAFIGSGATVIQGRKIGSNAIVAAGATVVKSLEPKQILMGWTARLKDV